MSAGKVRQGGVFVEIGADATKFFSALQRVNKSIASAGRAMQALGTRMAAVGTAIAAPLAIASRQFAAFDDAIRATAAVSGAAGASLQSLNDKARELGATTSFTAIQVANLMTELGRAGFRPDDINAMTSSVLNLARATGTEASRAAGIMAATLRQFGLDAVDAGRAADVLTKAANATFNTVEGLGESLKYAGPVAKELGMSLEDTVAILGVLGNVGIQGSMAGMALKRLSVISAASGEQLQKLFGISNTDAAGNMKPLVDILEEINQATADMPVAERTAKMAKAFGLLGITSASVLSNTAGGVRGLADDLRNAEGTAAATAKEMDAGLGGALRIARSAIEGTTLAVGEALAPSLQKMVEGVTAVATGLTRFVKDNQELIVSVGRSALAFVAAGGALITLGGGVQVASFALGGLLKVFVALPASVLSSVAALVKYVVASTAAGVASVTAAAKIASSWTVTAATAVAKFVASSAVALGTYTGQAAIAAAVTVSKVTAIATAWTVSAAAGVASFAVAADLALGGYVAEVVGAVAATLSQAAAIATAWVTTAAAGVTSFAVSVDIAIGGYLSKIGLAVAGTVAAVAKIAAAWIGKALSGVLIFAGSAAMTLAGYLGSLGVAVAATAVSTAAMAAAWLAPAAPLVALAGLAYAFSGQIKSALGGVPGLASQAGQAIGSSFSGVLNDAMQVFSDLGRTASATFKGIYEAVAAGDLMGAMDILWAGLHAGWLRGVEALMGYVDGWVAAFQNVFTYAGAGIAVTWEEMWSGLVQGSRTFGAMLQGAFDNVINGVLAAWDTMEAAVRKSWNYVQSFIRRGFDLAKENNKVKNEMDARARAREASRPGIAGRMAAADASNRQTASDAQERIDAIRANARDTVSGREQVNDDRAAARRAATVAAEQKLTELVGGQRDTRIFRGQADNVTESLDAATTMQAVRNAAEEFHLLAQTGALTESQMEKFNEAVDKATDRIEGRRGEGEADPDKIKRDGQDAIRSQAEVAGTFSAAAVGGMGFGQSLAQKQLSVLEDIERNTREDEGALVG